MSDGLLLCHRHEINVTTDMLSRIYYHLNSRYDINHLTFFLSF